MYLFEILQQSKNIESQNSLLLPLPYPNKKTRNQNNISKYIIYVGTDYTLFGNNAEKQY